MNLFQLWAQKISEWTAKNINKGDTINDWLKEIPIQGDKKDTFLPLKSGFDASDKSKKISGKPYKNTLGYLHTQSSNIQKSERYVGIYSSFYGDAHGRDITQDNYNRVAITFSIRRSIYEYLNKKKKLWIRDKDIFTAPSSDLLTDEFIADCVVYSLFDTQSNQTSLRSYEYNGKKYRVENEFFPFSMQFVENLAIKHNNMDIQADLTGEHERFVYSWLEEHEDDLSIEAKALLEKAKELYEITFEYRDEYALSTPRYQTNSWDAGYAQIARLAFGNERINDEFLEYLF